MDSELISLDFAPTRSARVKRRRAGAAVILVADGSFYELDAGLDALWRAMDGQASIREIAENHASGSGLQVGEALAATVSAFAFFREEGLLAAPPTGDEHN